MSTLCPEHSREWQRWLDYQVSPRLRLEASAAYDFTPQGIEDKRRARADDWASTVRFQQALILRACATQCSTTRKPKLLDLFCCQGGAATGYHQAGWDVTGVDIKPQPRYPFAFVQADALTFLAEHGHEYDAIHASPPCHDHVRAAVSPDGTGWLLSATRDLLSGHAALWVIENVPGAPMRPDYQLCGCMFGLPLLKRQRWFETSWHGFALRPPCQHSEHPISVVGDGIPSNSWWYGRISGAEYHRMAKEAMGIDWMSRRGLSQAIPPAYTCYIGELMLAELGERAA